MLSGSIVKASDYEYNVTPTKARVPPLLIHYYNVQTKTGTAKGRIIQVLEVDRAFPLNVFPVASGVKMIGISDP